MVDERANELSAPQAAERSGVASAREDLGLLLLRLGGGGFMLTHGLPKLLKLFTVGAGRFPDPFGIGATASLSLAVFSEVFCAALLILGFRTRWASLPLIVTMGVAAFLVHGADPFKKKELALIYLCIYLALALFGGGRFSLDALFARRKGLKS